MINDKYTLITILIISKVIPLLCDNNINEDLLNRKELNKSLAPLRKNLTECAREVGASSEAITQFLMRAPQKTHEGRCMVSCLFNKNNLYVNKKISKKAIIDVNRAAMQANSNYLPRLLEVVDICIIQLDSVNDMCDYASGFNDCVLTKMEYVVNKDKMKAWEETVRRTTDNPINLNDEFQHTNEL